VILRLAGLERVTRRHRKWRIAPQRRIDICAPAAPELAAACAALHRRMTTSGAQADAHAGPIAAHGAHATT
jgi:hypothetical protein